MVELKSAQKVFKSDAYHEIIGLLLNDSMLCKPKKTLYQS